jgi:hypothetical protein
VQQSPRTLLQVLVNKTYVADGGESATLKAGMKIFRHYQTVYLHPDELILKKYNPAGFQMQKSREDKNNFQSPVKPENAKIFEISLDNYQQLLYIIYR